MKPGRKKDGTEGERNRECEREGGEGLGGISLLNISYDQAANNADPGACCSVMGGHYGVLSLSWITLIRVFLVRIAFVFITLGVQGLLKMSLWINQMAS